MKLQTLFVYSVAFSPCTMKATGTPQTPQSGKTNQLYTLLVKHSQQSYYIVSARAHYHICQYRWYLSCIFMFLILSFSTE